MGVVVNARRPMTLRQYVKARGTSARLSALLGVSPCTFSSWLHKRRRVPASRCLDIERVTLGHVRAETLRPDLDWTRVRRRRS